MMLQILLQTLPQVIKMFFALHVSSGHSFPKPLSRKEERQCLEMISKGDVDAKNKLIEHNLRLVVHIIKKYYSNVRCYQYGKFGNGYKRTVYITLGLFFAPYHIKKFSQSHLAFHTKRVP